MKPEDKLIALTADIVAGYVANNATSAGDLPTLIRTVHDALATADRAIATAPERPTPITAAQIRKSITPEALISFIDGKPYRSLKRHLTTNGLTVTEYKERFGLPHDYPTVAQAYREQRSALAKSIGLGRKGRPAPAARPVVDQVDPEEAPPPKPPRKLLGLFKTK